MDKIFLETSFFIRYFTGDDKKKAEDCSRLLTHVESGKFRPYISNIIIFEILFVLTRIYQFTKKEVLEAIQKILTLRNLTLIEKTNTEEAINLFGKLNIKYPDCLIAGQIPKGAKIVTYDADFSKLPGISASEPADFLNK